MDVWTDGRGVYYTQGVISNKLSMRSSERRSHLASISLASKHHFPYAVSCTDKFIQHSS